MRGFRGDFVFGAVAAYAPSFEFAVSDEELSAPLVQVHARCLVRLLIILTRVIYKSLRVPARMIVGEVIAGSFEGIVAREKDGSNVEVGELLVSVGDPSLIVQVTGIEYASQLSQQNRELIAGLRLEDEAELNFFDRSLRTYTVLSLKLLAELSDGEVRVAKRLPAMFSVLRRITDEDVSLVVSQGDLFAGMVRSGSRVLETPLRLDSQAVLSHHVLVAAQTGKGKSNLMKCILADALENRSVGVLVLDPHDEYFGRKDLGLKDLASSDLLYFSGSDHPRAQPLRFRIDELKPRHFDGVASFSQAQHEAIASFRRKHRDGWIDALLSADDDSFHEATLQVLKRRFSNLLSIAPDGSPRGIFVRESSSLAGILSALEDGKTVVIDTSLFAGAHELLIGSIITSEVFDRYRSYKQRGIMKPQISIVIEEAPRVLGKSVLAHGSNAFDRVAREGRKFGVGLVAITQVPSLIQREILANMNTKIVLGLEMALERNAIIESAAQDISDLSGAIASLEKGEAIITSSFVRFPMPVKMPLFSSLVPSRDHPEVGSKVSF